MKINIDAPIKQQEIMDILGADPRYTYLGHPQNKRQTLQYEVNPDDFPGDPVAITKATIKATPFGKSIALRVLEDGKSW